MTKPQRAPVRPRVTTPESGEPIALDHKIATMLSAGFREVIYVCGPAGSGKTTALQHLAAVLPADAPVVLLDGDVTSEAGTLTVCAVETAPSKRHGIVWQLASWTDDDLIEYLLARHHDRCAEILARMPDRAWLDGNPQLCTIVLEELASDASLACARDALLSHLHHALGDSNMLEQARALCLDAQTDGGVSVFSQTPHAGGPAMSSIILDLLRHTQVQRLLAAEQITEDLQARRPCDYLAIRLPRDLIRAVGASIATLTSALSCLEDLLAGDSCSHHAMAASLLHEARGNWLPQPRTHYILAGAYLSGVAWPELDLTRIDNLRQADLSHANLAETRLDGVNAGDCDLSHANLTRASLVCFRANDADLTNANLTEASAQGSQWKNANLAGADLSGATLADASFLGANLRNARFKGAVLSRAVFTGAKLVNTDFSRALLYMANFSGLDLRHAMFPGARFSETDLSKCNMEQVNLPNADLTHANLFCSLLTGANLSGARLEGANLREAGLAHINLAHADLRNADFEHASFHLGSSRSGLVNSPIASEGSRTGFYTDDADERGFKDPEDIRKANLCFADLRGARVTHTDFYLVDLRGATYDKAQEAHFRRCRAILD